MLHLRRHMASWAIAVPIAISSAGAFGQSEAVESDAQAAAQAAAKTPAGAVSDTVEDGFTSLFDGRTLDGWEGNLEIFRVRDHAILAGDLNKRVERNEFLCTKETYEDFELRLEFKLLGEKPNAGVQIRSQRIPDHHEVCGYQADLGVGWWGCLYDESRPRKVLAGPELEKRSEPVRLNDWNDYRIRCQGKRVQLWVNDVQTVDYEEQDPDIETKGIIGLQVHAGAPMEAWYRNVRIKKL